MDATLVSGNVVLVGHWLLLLLLPLLDLVLVSVFVPVPILVPVVDPVLANLLLAGMLGLLLRQLRGVDAPPASRTGDLLESSTLQGKASRGPPRSSFPVGG